MWMTWTVGSGAVQGSSWVFHTQCSVICLSSLYKYHVRHRKLTGCRLKKQQPGPFFDLLDAHHLCRRTAGISSPEWSCWLRGKLLAIEQRKSSEISSQMTTATAFHTMASGLPYQPLCRLPWTLPFPSPFLLFIPHYEAQTSVARTCFSVVFLRHNVTFVP